MSDPQRNETHDAAVETVLGALSEASPTPGFEDRLLRRLESQKPSILHPPQRSMFPFAFSAALAGCVLCAVAVRQHHASANSAPVQSVRDLTHTPAVLPGASPDRTSAASTVATGSTTGLTARSEGNPGTASRIAFRGVTTKGGTDQPASRQQAAEAQNGSQQDASFPAPEMPLTAEERLLIQIARRNDPVQVALLDQHERNLTIARERAESRQFFAPRPLPPELQHEIDTAVEAQYAVSQPTQDRTKP